MAFGILECYRMERVPGTALLRDQNDIPEELRGVATENLKHAPGSNVLLVPQPSDDPNDPLNWPLWKKDMVLFIIGMNAAVVGAYGPMLGPGFVPIAKNLGITVEVLGQATAWLILAIGLCVFIFNPLAKLYGKRPVYIFCSIILFVVSIWGALARSYNEFLISRILGGIGMGPYEVLVQATISDLYFVHQRATRLAVWNAFLLCGICGAGFISGYVIEDLGYEWTFGLCAILFGIFGIGVIFLVPETSYRRPSPRLLHVTGEKLSEKGGSHTEHSEVAAVDIPPKQTYVQSLRVFNGVFTNAPVWKIFARPFIMLLYPAVIWGFLIYGTTLTWIVVFSVVNGVVFTQAPYNFTVGQAGLTALSPFVLTIIGEGISGPLNDFLCLWFARRNKGVYEPEFRLVLMTVVVVVGAVGFYGFGITIHYETHWTGPVLCYGLANMALAFASTCVFGYVLDCFPRLSEEAFVAINTRNFLTFGLTYFVNGWLAQAGALVVFNILGSLFVAVCALTLPLWVFGKRIRSWIARNEFLDQFMTDNA